MTMALPAAATAAATSAAAPPVALELQAEDGTRLAARLYEPAGPVRGHVLVAGALAVPQRFYAPFAGWLAGRGHRVLTFDPRGIGASRLPAYRQSLRGLQADMLTWARQDFAAALGALAAMNSGRPVTVIGHSLGLHLAAMTTPAAQGLIERAVGVASGAGHWRTWAAPTRRRAPLIFYLAGPLATALCGYFPGKRLRMVGDLPAGVLRQWSRWCCHDGFAWGAEPALLRPSLDAARFPLIAFSIADDESMTEGCTRCLLAALPNVPSALRRIAPGDAGLPAIGHLGAFRPAAAALWPTFEDALISPRRP